VDFFSTIRNRLRMIMMAMMIHQASHLVTRTKARLLPIMYNSFQIFAEHSSLFVKGLDPPSQKADH